MIKISGLGPDKHLPPLYMYVTHTHTQVFNLNIYGNIYAQYLLINKNC